MKAVIIAPGFAPDIAGLTKTVSAEMLPLIDRPFLQHIVEHIVANGIKKIEFILNDHANAVETFFGTGQRWGIECKYHLCTDAEKPFETLKNIFRLNSEDCILVYGDRLAFCPLNNCTDNESGIKCSIWKDGDKEYFAGMAHVSGEYIESLESDMTLDAFGKMLTTISECDKFYVEEPMFVNSYQSYLHSTGLAMTKYIDKLMVSGKVKDEAIWISRNVVIHPTAKLIPPLYLGQDCRIAAGCILGPGVISDGCIIDKKTSIKESVVLKDSYVGEGLELDDVIIDKSLLVNAKHNSVLNIPDPYILGSMADQSFQTACYRLFVRFSALILFVITLPLLLITAVRLKIKGVKQLFVYDDFVSLPTVDEPLMWKTVKVPRFNTDLPDAGSRKGSRRRREFVYYTIPGLISVIYGKLYVVGSAGRTPDEILKMNQDWRDLYLQSKVGIISEASVVYDNKPNDDELYTAEAFCAVHNSFLYTLKLFVTYIFKLFIP